MIEYRESGIWLATSFRPRDHIVNNGPFYYMHEFWSEIIGPTTPSMVDVYRREINFISRGMDLMNIEMYQRNHRLEEYTLKKDGAPLVLDGVILVFKVEGVLEKTIGNGIKVLDDSAGMIEIEITAEDTDKAEGTYPTELLVQDIATRRYTVETGRFKIMKSIVKEVIA
ncbi:hypothetical protein [Evansella tamaricis]|uniref:Uncharacterized protein n=1 Tax=Evansella tamaricis TaxID=2069301 RepID=A0ABS6JBW3_9BACI|nr:hypothetical protein [Evansella tamaricis]MBU9711056.1 hypothetical protein [Evansella tamaricis]